MILFAGDSFTWGQGLEWEYLIQNEGYTIDKINTLIPPKYACERLPIHLQDYREKNRWPRLVAEYFNTNYDTLRCGNGGSNGDIYKFLDNFQHIIHPENVDLIVIQFTHSGRDLPPNFLGPTESIFINEVNVAKSVIQNIEKKYPHINIVTLSWLPEIGKLVEKELGEKYVIKLDGDYGFENWISTRNLNCTYEGMRDSHFNLEGHRELSKYVITHLVNYNLIKKNTFYEI